MRVVGYVRETAGPQSGESAYAQAERIRRWASDTGYQLVAVCQDVRVPGRAIGRDGYRALLGILATGGVDAVIVASLDAMAGDRIVQEIMVWDLRQRGATVISAAGGDHEQLADPPADRSRLLIRDVMARLEEYAAMLGDLAPNVIRIPEGDVPELIVELVPPADERETLSGG